MRRARVHQAAKTSSFLWECPSKGIVIDTNVFVAAGFNPRSASARVLARQRQSSTFAEADECYAFGPRPNSAADGTIASSGSMAPRLSTMSKRRFFAWAIYLLIRTWCWPGTISAGPPGPSAMLA